MFPARMFFENARQLRMCNLERNSSLGSYKLMTLCWTICEIVNELKFYCHKRNVGEYDWIID